MKTETRFQFWSLAGLAKTILFSVAMALILVVAGSLAERPLPESDRSQRIERQRPPGASSHRLPVHA
jgi:hypothetical protein